MMVMAEAVIWSQEHHATHMAYLFDVIDSYERDGFFWIDWSIELH